MSNTNTGGPAFPYEERNGEGAPYKDYFGMTLRDYFAAKALNGLLAASLMHEGVWKQNEVAETAYEIADAMLKAREA